MRIRHYTVVTSLNIRSLLKHVNDLRYDFTMNHSKIMCIQETWCSSESDNSHLNIDGFNLHLTNQGRGKGIATYYKSNFWLSGEVNNEKFQMVKFSSDFYHVINVYRSQGADTKLFIQQLNLMTSNLSNCIIVGDFNIDNLATSHPIIDFLLSQNFEQQVKIATHEQGGILDYAFVKHSIHKHKIHHHWPYYSDHAAICVVALV